MKRTLNSKFFRRAKIPQYFAVVVTFCDFFVCIFVWLCFVGVVVDFFVVDFLGGIGRILILLPTYTFPLTSFQNFVIPADKKHGSSHWITERGNKYACLSDCLPVCLYFFYFKLFMSMS